MKKIIYVLALLLFSSTTLSANNIKLIYATLEFSIPSGFSTLADLHNDENFLVFKYGTNKSADYLAFTNMTNDSSLEYGCLPYTFYNDLFSNANESQCNAESLTILRDVFINNATVDIWHYKHAQLNYSQKDGKSFVFLTTHNGKLIKIDSDFIIKQDLKNIFAPLNQ